MKNYPTRPDKHVTEARIERIRELRAKGMSYAKIADELNVSTQSVHQLSVRYGILKGVDRPAIPLHEPTPPAARSPE